MATNDKTNDQTKPKVKITKKALEEYVREHATADRAAPLQGLPFVRGGKTFVNVSHLQANLLGGEGTRQQVSAALRDMGAVNLQYATKRPDGTSTAPSYWRLDRTVSGVPEQEGARAAASGGNGDQANPPAETEAGGEG